MRVLVVLGVCAATVLGLLLIDDLHLDTGADIAIFAVAGFLVGLLTRGWWILFAPALLVLVAIGWDLSASCDPDTSRCEGGLATVLAVFAAIPAVVVLSAGVLTGKGLVRWLGQR
jgi:hypothetical protein